MSVADRLRARFEDEPDFLGHEAADWMDLAVDLLREIRKGWCGELDETAPAELHRAAALISEFERP